MIMNPERKPSVSLLSTSLSANTSATTASSNCSPFRTQLTCHNTQRGADPNSLKKGLENKENQRRSTSIRRSMMLAVPDCSALWKEIEQRNVERDEMMTNIQALTEKNQNVKEALKREESVKHHQITIMKKTHETQLEIKNTLIRNLEDIIDEQEARIFNLESHIAGIRNLSPKLTKPLGGVKRLQELIDDLTAKNVELLEKCLNEEKLRVCFEQQLSRRDERCSCRDATFVRKFNESATDNEKQLKKVEIERNELKEHVKLLKNQLEQLESTYQTVKLEYDRLDVQFLEKSIDWERKENENRLRVIEEKSRLMSEIETLKLQIADVKKHDNEIKAHVEAKENLLETVQSRLSLERAEREKKELVVTEMKEICRKQEHDVNKWRSAVIDLEKQLEEGERRFEQEQESKRKELEMLNSTLNRFRRESSTWQQRHADTIISLDCFRGSLKCLREEQADLLQAASTMPSEVHQVLVNVRQQVSRHLSTSMSELVTKYKNEMRLRKEYHNQLIELRGNIRVFCRVRPVIPFDEDRTMPTIDFDPDDDSVLRVNNEGRLHTFALDKVFSPDKSQQDIFAEVRPLLTSCVDGYNVCIFAYGQTGSGKTYTMEGPFNDPGINQRSLAALFEETNSRKPDWTFSITVSMLEIYNENIRDLLSNEPYYAKLDVKMTQDKNLDVPGLIWIEVFNIVEVNKIFQIGHKNRVTAATNLNDVSSRSHAVLSVNVVGYNEATKTKTCGRLNLVDLAGSERVSKSAACGERLKEAQSINKSLSALGDVIAALKTRNQHIPFRNSKLTYLLQDSLAGNSKTVMVVQVAPLAYHVNETICSLNFAKRVRNVELGLATVRSQVILGQDLNQDENMQNFVRSPSLRVKAKPKK